MPVVSSEAIRCDAPSARSLSVASCRNTTRIRPSASCSQVQGASRPAVSRRPSNPAAPEIAEVDRVHRLKGDLEGLHRSPHTLLVPIPRSLAFCTAVASTKSDHQRSRLEYARTTSGQPDGPRAASAAPGPIVVNRCEARRPLMTCQPSDRDPRWNPAGGRYRLMML